MKWTSVSSAVDQKHVKTFDRSKTWISGQYILDGEVPAVVAATATPEVVDATLFVYSKWPEWPRTFGFLPYERVVWPCGVPVVFRYVSEGDGAPCLHSEISLDEDELLDIETDDVDEVLAFILPFLSRLQPFRRRGDVEFRENVGEYVEFRRLWSEFEGREAPDIWG